jgi:hypothetical protein
MRFFVDIEPGRFVVMEEVTESIPCPTCGHPKSRTVDRHISLIEGVREDEATWNMLKREPLLKPPFGFDEGQAIARKFANA